MNKLVKSELVKPKLVKPKTMSEALLLASKDKDIKSSRSCYLDDFFINDKPEKLAACAIGSIFIKVAKKSDIRDYIEDPPEDNRESLIEIICKKIKGACDPLPEEVLEEYYEMRNCVVFDGTYRWIDLAEWLFQYKNHSLRDTAKVLNRYNK